MGSRSSGRLLRRRELFGLATVAAGGLALGTADRAFASNRGHRRETIGGGTIRAPARGPGPSYDVGVHDLVLVKNWNFGSGGTIADIATMSENFQYHDQFGTIGNGTNYGALTVSPDAANALPGQPVEDPEHPVRELTADSLRTYLVPLDGATTVVPTEHNAGCGSFQAKWKLPNGGSLLGQDILWETRVRYVTPPYFWFAIWTSGNKWDRGAEMDVVETFGFDNGGGFTNYDGRWWHTNSVGGSDELAYADWPATMASVGVDDFDGSRYHVWQWLYRADDTYRVFMDGIEVQSGALRWTLGGTPTGEAIDMSFLFDAGWGHTQVSSVNHSLPATELLGKVYEWDYSRVYLSPPASRG